MSLEVNVIQRHASSGVAGGWFRVPPGRTSSSAGRLAVEDATAEGDDEFKPEKDEYCPNVRGSVMANCTGAILRENKRIARRPAWRKTTRRCRAAAQAADGLCQPHSLNTNPVIATAKNSKLFNAPLIPHPPCRKLPRNATA